jgi:hypothetical protein
MILPMADEPPPMFKFSMALKARNPAPGFWRDNMKCMTCKHDGLYYCRRGFLKRNAGERCPYYEKLKLYLCGQVTGDDDYRVKFMRAENKLYDAGFYPVNPAACIPAGTEWRQAMREAISIMLRCDGVALLSDWKASRGAKIEASLAYSIGIPVKSISEWESAGPHN